VSFLVKRICPEKLFTEKLMHEKSRLRLRIRTFKSNAFVNVFHSKDCMFSDYDAKFFIKL